MSVLSWRAAPSKFRNPIMPGWGFHGLMYVDGSEGSIPA
jgi:hypothetical protein